MPFDMTRLQGQVRLTDLSLPHSAITPSVLFRLLPRVAGADMSIHPTFSLTYPISQEDCRLIAQSCRRPLVLSVDLSNGHRKNCRCRIHELALFYDPDLVHILGSDLRRDPQHI